MSDPRSTFIDLATAGDVLPEEIDDYIDLWHANSGGIELHEFLGMTPDEYEFYLNSAEWLSWIIAARVEGRPLRDYIGGNSSGALAARGMDTAKAARLVAWLERHA